MPRAWALQVVALSTLAAATASAQDSFFNFESPHVNPIALDGDTLYVANTADSRLEIFDVSTGVPVWDRSIPVGLDPVSVRVRAATEVWLVNQISDSVSIVDLTSDNVSTLPTGNEPADVVFAGGQAFVSCSEVDEIWVYDLADLTLPPTIVEIDGQEPRALAVTPDGNTVVAAIFDSGNATTIIDAFTVSDPTGPYGGVNPPPNDGAVWNPPINGAIPPPPAASLILKRENGQWVDDNGTIWPASLVPWDVHDNDLALIDVATLGVSYINSLMNLNMHLAARSDGRLVVVGTDANNHIRFEPNIKGTFVHSIIADVDPAAPTTPTILDLNPHLAAAYAANTSTVAQNLRDDSIADPRGVAFDSTASTGYVSGMGSNNVAVIDAAGNRLARIDVGEGPTGLVLDESRDQLYVLNKFQGSISVIDTINRIVTDTVPFFDPTPDVIRDGRPFLYDARRTSGLGVTACGACHIDGRMDPVAWDLGNPAGDEKPFNQTCQTATGSNCEDFHPMKGPMVTQTFQGIIGSEPLHWRGDRDDLAEFNDAFVGLLGDDTLLTTEEMEAFEAFVHTLKFPPNPFRNADGSLPSMIGNGDPTSGRSLFRNRQLDGAFTCNDCHLLPTGTNGEITPGNAMFTPQSMKVAHLRNTHEKLGFDQGSSTSDRGFGLTHDGTVTTIVQFLSNPVFSFSNGATGGQERRDVTAFIKAFPNGTFAGVGTQLTVDSLALTDPNVAAELSNLVAIADNSNVGLIAKGLTVDGIRGYTYLGGDQFQSDRIEEVLTQAQLEATIGLGMNMTFTLVAAGTETRAGVDRDEDGALDRDELEHCGDPRDPSVTPLDLTLDGSVDLSDLATVITNFGLSDATPGEGDLNGDGNVDLTDLAMLISNFGLACP